MPDLETATKRYVSAVASELLGDMPAADRTEIVQAVLERGLDALIDHVHGLLLVELATEVTEDDEDDEDDEDEDEDEDEDAEDDEEDEQDNDLLRTIGRVVGTVLDATTPRPRGNGDLGRVPADAPRPPPHHTDDARVIDVVAEPVGEKHP